jgi:hypothetical protein
VYNLNAPRIEPPNASRLAQTGDIEALEENPVFDDDNSLFLTIDETAELLRIKRRMLDNLRWGGEGPPARRHGGRIVYHRDEVLDWSKQRRTRKPPQGTGDPPSAPDGGHEPQVPGNGEPEHGHPAPPVERKP